MLLPGNVLLQPHIASGTVEIGHGFIPRDSLG